MGFLSKYTGTKRIDLGDGFYVEVRKFLSAEQQGLVEQALTQPKIQVVGDGKGKLKQEMVAAMDYAAMRIETIAQALVSWNLTDEDDSPLAFEPEAALRASLRKLPGSVIRKVAEEIGTEPEDEEERATFPSAGQEGA
jgi:hypothetical protein